jgi:branched-chain amino acid aminotransferase
VDGRTIGSGGRGPVVERLQKLYVDLVGADVAGRTAS